MRPSILKNRIARLDTQINTLYDRLIDHDCEFDGHCTLCIKWAIELKNKRDARGELESWLSDYSNSNIETYGV